jgi:single-strand DNA-binding protein
MQVTKLGLAASEKYKDKETQLFLDATAFGKTAEFIATVSKGQRIFATGKIQTDQWEDKNTGDKRSKVSMIIESFDYVEKRDSATQQPAADYAPQQQGGAQNNYSDFQDDIPFNQEDGR